MEEAAVAAALAIGFVLLTLLLIGAMVATVWNKTTDKEQIDAERRGLETLDKALKGTDEPDEPARWVP